MCKCVWADMTTTIRLGRGGMHAYHFTFMKNSILNHARDPRLLPPHGLACTRAQHSTYKITFTLNASAQHYITGTAICGSDIGIYDGAGAGASATASQSGNFNH